MEEIDGAREGEFGKVVVILLNYNQKEYSLNCLESLYQIDYPDCEIVLVDNGSSDGSEQMVRENYPNTRLISNEVNVGFAQANNQAIVIDWSFTIR